MPRYKGSHSSLIIQSIEDLFRVNQNPSKGKLFGPQNGLEIKNDILIMGKIVNSPISYLKGSDFFSQENVSNFLDKLLKTVASI